MKREHQLYAGIGSRDLTPEQLEICRKLGQWFAAAGWVLHSGNAPGADQAFARGANRVDPSLVYLHLPWPKFESHALVDGNVTRCVEDLNEGDLAWYTAYAEKHHPAWGRLSQGAKKLMTRNGMIMLPFGFQHVDLCLAWPSNRKGGGGTGQGMRIAEEQGVRLINLNNMTQAALAALCDEVR
jgi:hypothetical protein